MHAVVLTGHGGFDALEYRTDVPVPGPAADQVLIRVGGAGVNNTDINTRIGWYSKTVDGDTAAGGTSGLGADVTEDGSWSGIPLRFPRIQGADACGEIVACGTGVDPGRIGQRVLVRTMQTHPAGDRPWVTVTLGSELDGAFAQYVTVHHREAYPIASELSDVELASFPCAYSTAEGLLHRARVAEGDVVLITGASGGVGSAAVQLARRRGADVVAVAGASKAEAVADMGASTVVHRGDDVVARLGAGTVDVVVDLVAGDQFGALLGVLRVGGTYATSGAIAGPIVELDVRTLYLKDLTLLGCTYQPPEVFENLVAYIERGEIRPLVAATYPLAEVVAAQERFLAKDFVGKIVLVPPGET